MKKSYERWSLAIVMSLLGLTEAISGFVLWLGFPTGGGGFGRGWGGGGLGNLTFWGLPRHTWTDIHNWLAIALIIIVATHIVLHWKWIVRMAKAITGGTPERRETCPVEIEID